MVELYIWNDNMFIVVYDKINDVIKSIFFFFKLREMFEKGVFFMVYVLNVGVESIRIFENLRVSLWVLNLIYEYM